VSSVLLTPPANWREGHLCMFVDPVNGSASFDGLSAQRPKASIQDAYDDLKAYAGANKTGQSGTRWGAGRVVLLPGDHDVGAGVVLDSAYSCEFVGFRSGFGHHFTQNFASRVLTTNSSCTSLISWGSDNFITRGMRFRDIGFVLGYGGSYALTSAIEAKATDYLFVDDCSFTTTDGNQSSESIYGVSLIIGTTANDCAWGRIRGCAAGGVGLLKCSSDMGNHNGWTIDQNHCFFNGSVPCIDLSGSGSGGVVSNNYVTGTAPFCQIGDRDGWVFICNEGESTADVPFYEYTGAAQGCVIIGGKCTLPSVNGTFVLYSHASAHSNHVIGGQFTVAGSTGMKQKVTDSTPTFKNVLSSTAGPVVRRIVSGAGKTRLADSDFPTSTNTPDGTYGVAVNTSDSKRYWCVRQNATWYGVEVT
jgi:hypothetical protein